MPCRRNSEGVRIVSNSYGCKTSATPDCYSANFERAINAFAKQGGLFVVSAGNDGDSNDKVWMRLIKEWSDSCPLMCKHEYTLEGRTVGRHRKCHSISFSLS